MPPIPLSECGDGLCMAEIGETCETCAADCCRTVFPVGGTVGIVVAGVLIPITVVLIILGVSGLLRVWTVVKAGCVSIVAWTFR